MTSQADAVRRPLPPAPVAPARGLLETLLRHGPLSRSQLAVRLGLSPASLSRLGALLAAAGLVSEGPAPHGPVRAGRPQRPLAVVADALRVVGVNLTADAATAVLTGLDDRVLARTVRPLRTRRPEDVAAVVAAVLDELEAVHGPVDLLGVSLGGTLTRSGVVGRAPFLGWSEVPLADLLRACTGRAVVVDNDLVALTKAVHWYAAPPADTFAVLTLGVGVGYGLVVHDRVVEGPDAGIGVLGHAPLGVSGRHCRAGHEGCAEAVLTGPALRVDLAAALGGDPSSLSYDDAVRLAAGDPRASALVEESAEALGRLVGTLCNHTLGHDVLLTGEGVGLAEAAPDAVRRGIGTVRDALARPVRLRVQPVDFGLYAQGAAVSAVRSWLTGDVAGPGTS